ncbi:hypothetical protein ABIC89_002485 [Variovorax boronicumulans]|uniref:hypothetical protein n=1 Tax=Variovorax boronicumulans TaxID=436515 RepID=UPI00339152D7
MPSKLDDPAQHRFYLKATARFGWNRNVLLNQIKAQACESSLAEGKVCKFALALPGICLRNAPAQQSEARSSSRMRSTPHSTSHLLAHAVASRSP